MLHLFHTTFSTLSILTTVQRLSLKSYFGNWKIFKFLSEEADDLDGFDPSGLIILQKERSWLGQGHKVGELVVPLARNFQNASLDVESGSNDVKILETKPSTKLKEEGNVSHSKPLKGEVQHENSREGITAKYKAKRAKQMKRENSLSSNGRIRHSPSSSREEFPMMDKQVQPSIGLSSTWRSMQTGFRNFKSNIETKGFIPLRQVQDAGHSRASSTESLDEIFERIKRPGSESTNYDSDDDHYGIGLRSSGPSR